MNRDDLLALCRKARDVGAVKHEEFVDYIVVLESRRKVGTDWQATEHAYMAVDGKLAMANEDHRRQSKRLDFAEPRILLDNPEQLTLQVMVTSEMYGARHGIATSRKKGGTSAEREFPWEVAETSAIGRALAAMGYGLLPGTGLASAEDMMRAGATVEKDRREGSRRMPLMSANQRAKLIEMYRERHAVGEADAVQGLDALFVSAFKHPMGEASIEGVENYRAIHHPKERGLEKSLRLFWGEVTSPLYDMWLDKILTGAPECCKIAQDVAKRSEIERGGKTRVFDNQRGRADSGHQSVHGAPLYPVAQAQSRETRR